MNYSEKRVIMICTGARGGMRSVVEGYRSDGLFEQFNVELLESHAEGAASLRLRLALSTLIRLLWLLVTRQVALVHCHSAMRGSFWRKSTYALLARAFGVPVIFHLHGSEMKLFVDQLPRPFRALIAWILARQSAVLVLSQSWFDYLVQIAPQAKAHVLPNYVNLPDLSLRTARTDPVVKLLFLGLVGRRKGVYELLPAMKQVVDEAIPTHLVIGGNGEVEGAKDMVQELRLDQHVELAGWVSGDAKARLFQHADAYVLPSHNEGLPMSLLEAMSWGMPVISTEVGGIPELVRNGIDGLLVPAGDSAKLAAAIARLCQDQALREDMGTAARQRVESTFSREAVLPRLEAIYQSLMPKRLDRKN